MKTLVVLFAVVYIAQAAPSFPGKDTWPETIRRDKKSPQGVFFAESTPLLDAPAVHIDSEDIPSPSARSFGLKKHFSPTIIKQHHNGYHQVYRNSEEERADADPQEDCSKQVKVKLCNKQNVESFPRSMTTSDNIHEDNLQTRIKLAKEAIEDIQKELNPKSAGGWKQRDIESDAEFQEDIEIARKALDHIHRSFGNLESMSLHKEPEHHFHGDSIKENEQRINNWKENPAMMNNAEIGRNIEDISQNSGQKSGLMNIDGLDTTQFMRNSNTEEKKITELPLKQTTVESNTEIKREANTEINKQKTVGDDMKVSATEINESKLELHSLPTSGKTAELPLDSTKQLDKKLDSDIKMSATEEIPVSMKAAEHHENSNTKMEKKTVEVFENLHKIVPNTASSDKMKAADNEEKMEAHAHTQVELNHKLDSPKHTLVPEGKSADTPVRHDMKMNNKDEKHLTDMKTSMKSVEAENTLKAINGIEELPAHFSTIAKSADMVESPNMRWATPTTEHDEHKQQLKFAEDMHNSHLKGMHMHTMPHLHHEQHFHVPHGHPMKFHGHPMHHMKSADTDEFMHPNLQMNLPEFSGKSAMDMFQWNHKEDGGRSAYGGSYGGAIGGGAIGGGYGGLGGLGGGSGAGAGAGAGAVGVFPSAHVSPCAVPLLLSCSPSVVPGSLAKSGYGSGYGSGPAYKNTEENVHNKRDIKKTSDVSGVKSKGTIAKTAILEKL